MSAKDTRTLRLLQTDEDFGRVLALRLQELAQQKTDRLTVALSAEPPIDAMIEVLRSEPFPWDTVRFFLTHDWQAMGGEVTQAHKLRELLPPEAHLTPLPNELSDPNETVERAEVAIERQTDGSFDLVIASLRTDGSAAGIGPEAQANDKHLVRVYRSTGGRRVIGLSPASYLAAKNVWVLGAGANLAAVVHEVLEGDYDPDQYPVQLIRSRHGELVWFLDHAAALRLAVAAQERQ